MKTPSHPGRKVAAVRALFDMSQQQFADRIGVTRGNLAALEAGSKPLFAGWRSRIVEQFPAVAGLL